ncbi:arachidonate 5-lipoxygenase-activating protein isoform X1 [Castor canadensis]|uniref:Arachidonate 5-lipoxygenase-activating protein isoform X1 n=1 Tax=Castor canadensis TaxID=51338 RepID=A0AC58K444_CASCN
MDQETVGNVVLLAIVTLISVLQNGFFAHKVEHESKMQNGRSFQRTGTLAFERVYTANQNCVDAYPTFLVVLWTAGLLCSQVPAAFAGLMYLFVRQKYFVGYLGERTQRYIALLRWTQRWAQWPEDPAEQEKTKHPWLHIWETNHLVPASHVSGWNTQLLPHLLFRKRL